MASEADSLAEAVWVAEPAVPDGEAGTVAAGLDSEHRAAVAAAGLDSEPWAAPVSYTHLTLPTIA